MSCRNESKPLRYPTQPQLESVGSSDAKDEGQQNHDMQNEICAVTCSAGVAGTRHG